MVGIISNVLLCFPNLGLQQKFNEMKKLEFQRKNLKIWVSFDPKVRILSLLIAAGRVRDTGVTSLDSLMKTNLQSVSHTRPPQYEETNLVGYCPVK